MRILIFFFLSLFILSNPAFSQNKTYTKTIEVSDGDNPTVSIKTESNGEVTEELLEGGAAKRYIKNAHSDSDKIVDLEITKKDIQALDEELQVFMHNIEKHVIEFNETSMDTTIQRINRRIDHTSKCIKKEICGAL
jgi:hypothetical protein